MRQEALNNLDMCNDRLVVAQTQVEIVAEGNKHEHEHAEPERRRPVTPLEGIVLHVLWSEELVDLSSIDLNLYNLESQIGRLHLFSVNLDDEGRQGIQFSVERCQSQGHSVGCGVMKIQHLYTWDQLLAWLVCRPLHLSIVSSLHGQSDLCLLAYKHLNRIYLCLNTALGHCKYRAGYQDCKYNDSLHQLLCLNSISNAFT